MKTIIKSCLAIICLSACVLGLIVPVSAADLSRACRISPSNSLRWNSRESLAGEIIVQVNPEQKEFYQAAADRVIKNYPGVKISLLEMEYKKHLNKLFDEAAARSVEESKAELAEEGEEKEQMSLQETVSETADLFTVSVASYRDLAKAGIISPLDINNLQAKTEDADSQESDDSLGSIFKVGKNFYAYPFGIQTMIALLNTYNVEQQNLSLEQPIEIGMFNQRDQLILPLEDFNYGSILLNSAALKPLYITKLAEDKYAIASDLSYSWDSLPEAMKVLVTALYNLYKLQKTDNLRLLSEDKYLDERNVAFTSGGKSIIALTDSPKEAEQLAELANNAKDLEYLSLSQLQLNGQPLVHWKGGWGLSLKTTALENPEKKAIAEAMIRELTNPDFAEELYLQSGTILDSISPEIYAKSESLEDSQKKIIALSLSSFAEAEKLPTVPGFDKVWGTWENGISSWAYLDVQNVEEAYKVLQVRFVKLLQQLAKKDYKVEIYSPQVESENQPQEKVPQETIPQETTPQETDSSLKAPEEKESESAPTETQEVFDGEYKNEATSPEAKESSPAQDDKYGFVELDKEESIPVAINRYPQINASFEIVDNTIENLAVVVDGEVYTISGYYKGETDEDELPHGVGQFITINTEGPRWSYDGEWNHGVMEGQGTIVWEEVGDMEYMAMRGFYSHNVMIYGGSVQTYVDGSWESSHGTWRYENGMPILSKGVYSSMFFMEDLPVYKAYDLRGENAMAYEPVDDPAGQWMVYEQGDAENYKLIDGPPEFWPIDYTE